MTCVACGKPADWLCDFPLTTERSCDRPVCGEHRAHFHDVHFAGDDGSEWMSVDYCPECANVYRNCMGKIPHIDAIERYRERRWRDLWSVIGSDPRSAEVTE